MMKRGLHIANGFNVNLDNVCVWIVEKETIQLQMVDSNLVNIEIENNDKTGFFNDAHLVSINEFKRIEREISEYMTNHQHITNRSNKNKETEMGKGTCTPPNGPSTTGNPSGGGRGNCPSK